MEQVLYEVVNRVGYITLNRPEKRNALNAEMVTDLKQAFKTATEDEQAKILVLRANGKVFCAGADLAYLEQLQANSYEENLADSRHLMDLFRQIYTLPKMVIAQVQGHAIAGGCGLATVCDLVFAVPDAKFGYTEVRIGFIPAIVKIFLLRKIGEARSKELLLTGELIEAELAQQWGMVKEVIPENELSFCVQSRAERWAEKNSGQSMALTKQMIGEVQDKTLDEALDYAAEMNARARASDDCKKGISAFLKDEKISW